MFWTKIKRISRSGFINFWRNGVVSVASIFVMITTLLVIGSLILASAFLTSSLDNIKNKFDISVSFKIDVPETDVLHLKDLMEKLPEVKSVGYVSREQELSNFSERHKDNSLIMQSVAEVGNPFGARLNIRAKDPSQYESIARFLGNTDQSSGFDKAIIDQVTFKKDIVDRLVRIIDAIQKVGLVASIALILMSILVTFNTISLTIYSTREEIGVMRLVGASNNFVRGPFMIEGMIAGAISSVVALVMMYPITLWLKGATDGVYGGIDLASYYASNFIQIFSILLLSGIALGFVSSYLAIARYLKR